MKTCMKDSMMTLGSNKPTRRGFLGAAAGMVAMTALPGMAKALSGNEAKALIGRAVSEINGIINSGKPESSMYGEFERVFAKYAYVDGIARSVLGPPARTASKAEMDAFAAAFQGYMARKWGKRFREFIGGEIVVEGTKQIKSFYEVQATAYLKGEPPFEVIFMVSDISGKPLFFDMLIEGVSLLKTERTEIGAMLDKRRGDLSAMIEDLKRAG